MSADRILRKDLDAFLESHELLSLTAFEKLYDIQEFNAEVFKGSKAIVWKELRSTIVNYALEGLEHLAGTTRWSDKFDAGSDFCKRYPNWRDGDTVLGYLKEEDSKQYEYVFKRYLNIYPQYTQRLEALFGLKADNGFSEKVGSFKPYLVRILSEDILDELWELREDMDNGQILTHSRKEAHEGNLYFMERLLWKRWEGDVCEALLIYPISERIYRGGADADFGAGGILLLLKDKTLGISSIHYRGFCFVEGGGEFGRSRVQLLGDFVSEVTGLVFSDDVRPEKTDYRSYLGGLLGRHVFPHLRLLDKEYSSVKAGLYVKRDVDVQAFVSYSRDNMLEGLSRASFARLGAAVCAYPHEQIGFRNKAPEEYFSDDLRVPEGEFDLGAYVSEPKAIHFSAYARQSVERANTTRVMGALGAPTALEVSELSMNMVPKATVWGAEYLKAAGQRESDRWEPEDCTPFMLRDVMDTVILSVLVDEAVPDVFWVQSMKNHWYEYNYIGAENYYNRSTIRSDEISGMTDLGILRNATEGYILGAFNGSTRMFRGCGFVDIMMRLAKEQGLYLKTAFSGQGLSMMNDMRIVWKLLKSIELWKCLKQGDYAPSEDAVATVPIQR